MTWRTMDSAPKGGGAELITDPEWVEPPKILLLFEDGEVTVAYWDLYYTEGGSGYYEGVLPWVEPCSGETLDLHYGRPIGWQPIEPPQEQEG